MRIQIYGVRMVEDALALAELGVDHIGLAVKPEAASVEEVGRVFAVVPPSMRKVLLPLTNDLEEIVKLVEELKPDILHISSDVDVIDASALVELRRRLKGVQLMKAIPVGLPGVSHRIPSLEKALEYQEYADFLILDTFVGDRSVAPNEMPGWIGITGTPHDWELSRQIVERCSRPVILAGGLSPENVVEAMEKVRPWGVDSCTPLDLYPGKKDLAKVRRFVEIVRKWER